MTAGLLRQSENQQLTSCKSRIGKVALCLIIKGNIYIDLVSIQGGNCKMCVTVLKEFQYVSKYLHNTDKMTDTRIVDVCSAGC